MKFHLLRTVLAFAVLFIVSTVSAQAGTVSCPTQLTLNHMPFPNITNPAPTAAISGGKLNCSFAVYYSDTKAVHVVSPGVCAPTSVSLNFGVSGGSAGTWQVSPSPVVLTSHYLKTPTTGGPGGTVRRGLIYCYVGTTIELYATTPAFTLTASQPIPAGNNCQVTGPNSFTCTPPTCPTTIASSQIPTAQFPNPPWSPLPTTGTAWFYQPPSGLEQLAGTTANGAVFLNQNVSRQTIVDAMNQKSMPAFNGSSWTTPYPQGAPISMPAGYTACLYKGPQFPYSWSNSNYTFVATVGIVCKGSYCSLR